MKIDINKINKLILYLCTLKGWGIKNYDDFIVSWEDDDGFTNFLSYEHGSSSLLERLSKNAKQILIILDLNENLVHILHKDAKYMEEKYGIKALE